jgi:hypothetical protein
LLGAHGGAGHDGQGKDGGHQLTQWIHGVLLVLGEIEAGGLYARGWTNARRDRQVRAKAAWVP